MNIGMDCLRIHQELYFCSHGKDIEKVYSERMGFRANWRMEIQILYHLRYFEFQNQNI